MCIFIFKVNLLLQFHDLFYFIYPSLIKTTRAYLFLVASGVLKIKKPIEIKLQF